MTEKDKALLDLKYMAEDATLKLFDSWQCCYSEWLTLDEYIEKATGYIKDTYADIKRDIENEEGGE